MAAFFIGRDFNARPGLAWCGNDKAAIIHPGNEQDQTHQDNLNDIAGRDVERSGFRQELHA